LPRSEGLQKFLLDQSHLKMWLKRLAPAGLRLALRKRLLAHNVQASKLPAMDADIEAHLRSVYREDVERLGELTGRDLSAWLPKSCAE
jgi:hypothetical protein